MSYYKTESNGYILAVGTGNVGKAITETEYNNLLSVIHSAPSKEGYGYRLRTDMTWEDYELPPIDDSEDDTDATESDYITALQDLGVEVE